jgi:hypothetical protein
MVPEYMESQNSPNGRIQQEKPKLPAFNYYLDESDPDILVLRREDGTFVAAFSPSGATREGLVEAAKEDYRDFLRGHWRP